MDPNQGGTMRNVRAGEVLMSEDAESTTVYRLVAGRLSVMQRQPRGPEVALPSIEPGRMVGELAVLAGGPRTATVTAAVDSVVESFSKSEFEALMARDSDLAAEVTQLAIQRIDQNALRSLIEEMVSPIGTEVLAELEKHVKWLRLPAGEVLYRQGDPGDGVYYVVSGRLRADSPDHATTHGRGDTLGESGLILAMDRRRTVTAIRDSGLLFIDRVGFESVAREHLDSVLFLLRELGQRSSKKLSLEAGRSLTLADARGPSQLSEDIVEVIRQYGTAAYVSAELVDTALGMVGLAESAPGDPAEYRVGEYIHQAEVDHNHMVYGTTDPSTAWARRSFRQSDHVVILSSPNPDEEELDRIRRFVGLADSVDANKQWLVMVHPAGTDRPRGTAEVLASVGLLSALHLREGNSDDLARVARIVSGHGVAVVFSGGGARGFAHLGAYRALIEQGVPIDLVGGSSMGAVMASFLSLGISADEIIPFAKSAFHSLLDYTLPVVSLVKGRRISRGIEENFGTWSFGDTWRPLVCVSTNLTKSTTEIHRTGPLAHAVRASVAIPGVLPPVAQGDDLLVDGGVLDNLPIDVVREQFEPGTVIALDVTPPRGPSAKHDYGTSISGWSALFGRLFRKRRYPSTVATLLRSTIAASVRERDRQVSQGRADLYVQMPLRGIGLLDFERVHEVADAGYEAALPQIQAWAAASEVFGN